jgi:NAD(P)-dependent dehydrogenase (short-subunit alcohol dehydrogenase family)
MSSLKRSNVHGQAVGSPCASRYQLLQPLFQIVVLAASLRFGVTMDVRQPEAVAAAFDAVEGALGAVDVLVNNAAGNFPVAAADLSPNGWRSVVDIVLNGTFMCAHEFAARRIAADRPGAILNIGATYAWTGGPGAAHSAAAKAGVTNLTMTLAVEWALGGGGSRGVRADGKMKRLECR